MLWFQHRSDLASEPEIEDLIDTGGPEAYGCLMLLMEAVCAAYKADGEPTLSLTRLQWARRLRIHHHKLTKLFGNDDDSAVTWQLPPWVLVSKEGGKVEVTIPKLRDLKDEYTRKSGHSRTTVQYSTVQNTTVPNREGEAPEVEREAVETPTPPHPSSELPKERAKALQKVWNETAAKVRAESMDDNHARAHFAKAFADHFGLSENHELRSLLLKWCDRDGARTVYEKIKAACLDPEVRKVHAVLLRRFEEPARGRVA